MINKEIFLFFTIIFFIGYIFFDISEQTALLIFLSAIFLYLSLNRKNRYIGLPALVATFTVLFFLYLAGLVGSCHLCKTEKDGVVFYCNRIINLAPLNYSEQIGAKECKKELIWRWP